MKLFDLHCDTPYELYKKKKHLADNSLHVSLEKAKVFEKYIQCAAVWSDSALTDGECFEFFKGAAAYFEKEAGGFINTRKDLANCKKDAFILTVEDSRLLGGDIDRLEYLFKKGVRVLTLMWGGKSSVGAAWNSDGGLTSFGKEVLLGCFDTGIIPDISHSNDEVSDFVIARAMEKHLPVIATHSNSRTVHPHLRNLSDENARGIAKAGGIIGISLFPPHLGGEKADISDIIDHITHYINILGTESVCLGCDLDGISSTPEGICSLDDLPRLYDALCSTFTSNIAESVFYNNAYNFFINNLP